MADNYLERRMEDYRAGRLRTQSRPPVKGSAAAPVPELAAMRVFLLTPSVSSSPRAEALVRLLRSQGCRVAFTDTDAAAGNRLAQATGAQCHPVDCADEEAVARSREIIIRRWGGIDATITL